MEGKERGKKREETHQNRANPDDDSPNPSQKGETRGIIHANASVTAVL
jgi:hypothetical protein